LLGWLVACCVVSIVNGGWGVVLAWMFAS
jgi:hypothetical protein